MADDRAKVIALVEKFWELHYQQADILNELSLATLGGQSVGDQMRELRAVFCAEWKLRYQSVYVWNFTQYNAMLHRLLVKNRMPKAVILERMDRYFTGDDPFYINLRHPFPMFVDKINSLVGLPLQHLDPSAETRDRLQGLRGE